MQPVFGLVEYNRIRTLDDFVFYFFAPMGGEVVHDYRVGLCQPDKLSVQDEARKVFLAACSLLLLAHADPDIGVEHVGAFRGGLRVAYDFNIAAVRLGALVRETHMRLWRVVSL